MRRARTKGEAANYYNTIPYASYTLPSSVRAQDNSYLETNTFNLNLENGEENDICYSDPLQTSRHMTTILECEYEDVD